MIKKGVLYCAAGAMYYEEAVKSALTLKAFNPSLPVMLFTDMDHMAMAQTSGYFDYCSLIENPTFSFRDKISSLRGSLFEKTLFLDTDTAVLANIDEIFSLLDRFDLAAAHEHSGGIIQPEEPNKIPLSFPQLNTGVIAFNGSLKLQNFLKQWIECYDQHLGIYANDQSSFREILYNSDLSIYVLRPEYNFRLGYPSAAITAIKIIHDHSFLNLKKVHQKKIIKQLNSFLSKQFKTRPLLWTGASDSERPGHQVRLWVPFLGTLSQYDLQSAAFRGFLGLAKLQVSLAIRVFKMGTFRIINKFSVIGVLWKKQ